MAIHSLPSDTVENMVFSAGLSALVSAVINKGNPITMAAIGGIAALVHACATVILKRINLDSHSVARKTGLPIEVTASIQSVLSLVLTERLVRVLGGPTFDVAKSAIIAIGLTILAIQNMKNSVVFLTLA